VQVRDHDRVCARKLAPTQRGCRLVCTLREHGVGLEVAQLTRDAEGQRREERRAVERR